MRIAFIGAGKVGTSMGIYLYNKGFEIAGYYSHNLSSAKKAALYTEGRAFTNIENLCEAADLIAVTTPDDVINDILVELSKLQMAWESKAVFHMSGVHSSNIFGSLGQVAAAVFSLHPMLSFSEPTVAVNALKTAIFTLEGKGKKFPDIKKYIKLWGNQIVEIATDNKVLYHTAASVVSNYLVTLLDIGVKMLKDAGFTEKNAKDLIQPLVLSTYNNIIDYGTEQALTGPISRGDAGTIEKHVKKISEMDKRWLDIYKALGIETIELAKRAEKINTDSAVKLREVLERYV